MADFTPGPWRTEIDNVFAGPIDNSVYVADCAPMGGPVEGRPEQIANACLIAAAPELLEAGEELAVELERIRFGNCNPMLDKLKLAIAKARAS